MQVQSRGLIDKGTLSAGTSMLTVPPATAARHNLKTATRDSLGEAYAFLVKQVEIRQSLIKIPLTVYIQPRNE